MKKIKIIKKNTKNKNKKPLLKKINNHKIK